MIRILCLAMTALFMWSAAAVAQDIPNVQSCQALLDQGVRGPCDDGLFCNGLEKCEPGNPAASMIRTRRGFLTGCVPSKNPCDGAPCDEDADICVVGCIDRDGDGFGAMSCGGRDCDDTDANRFPGNNEICDGARKDEDCDPTTFGTHDRDGDGYIDLQCTVIRLPRN